MAKLTFELCVPAYNEAKVIGPTVATLAALLDRRKDWEWRLTVADNGSTDGTAEIVHKLGLLNVRVAPISDKGKGGAVCAVARASDADIFAYTDADLSADPECLFSMVEQIERGEADAVVGSRVLDPSRVNRGTLRKFLSWCFRTLRNLLLSLEIEDSQCPMKVMNREARAVLAACDERTWFFDLEFLAGLGKKKLRFKEVPINWEENRYEGRESKIRFFRDAFGALAAMFRIRSRMRNGFARRVDRPRVLLEN
ncbi:glycosyltransferase [Candidatus Parcubacteria bacterium]|nr:glycosyltransferase [Candidatus Parcubacteria bacterium]